MGMWVSFLFRWTLQFAGDQVLAYELRMLREDLAKRDAEIRVLKVELRKLAGVAARDLQRVRSESAVATGQIVKHLGTKPEAEHEYGPR